MKKLVSTFLGLLVSVIVSFSSLQAFAHEKTFPTKQLAALTPEGVSVTFKEVPMRPDASKLSAFEKQHNITFLKGELAGNLFIGSSTDKKAQIVAVFLDGKSERGDTEFGAAVNTKGRVAMVQVFSSSEPAASKEFLATLVDKNADELREMMTQFEKEPSKQFLTKLTLKAVGRVSSSFK